MAQVTVLGLGAMGARMAARLLGAGHELTVWNRSPEKAAALVEAGARRADTPRSAVAEAEFAVAMVRDDEASRRVWLDPGTGALAGMRPDAVAVECSTVSLGWMQELATRFAEQGRAFLDAPVVGSRPQAEAGQLIVLAGGDQAVLARAEPILGAVSGTVHHAGPAGSGAAVKLAVNALFGIQLAAVAELIGLLRRSGLDAGRAVAIIGATPVCSPAAKGAAAAMLAEAYAPLFPIELVEKDFSYALATGATSLPLVEAGRGVFARAIAQGFGGDNISGVARLYA